MLHLINPHEMGICHVLKRARINGISRNCDCKQYKPSVEIDYARSNSWLERIGKLSGNSSM